VNGEFPGVLVDARGVPLGLLDVIFDETNGRDTWKDASVNSK
jgi:hypothetical protein